MKTYAELFQNNEQKIVMLGGLPGSGKSTLAKEFEENGYVIICPDTYRGIVSKTKPGREHWTDAMHEGDQSVSDEAWKLAYKEAFEALNNGKSILFDAMLHTIKARRKNFGQFQKFKLPIFAIYLDVTLETSKQRNKERGEQGGRNVPDFVLKSKWRQQVFPTIEEGFQNVFYISNDLKLNLMDGELREALINSIIKNPREVIEKLKSTNTLKNVFPSLDECWNINQDNVHHNLLLHEHMIKAAELIENRSPEAVISALLHDVGKRKTKEYFAKVVKENDHFKIGDKLTLLNKMEFGATFEKISWNKTTTAFLPYEEVEFDTNAHFYDHDNVGAIDARRDLLSLGFSEEFANEVYRIILHHMELPYKEASDKQISKLINKFGEKRIFTLWDIRKADKSSGSNSDGILDFHDELKIRINKLLMKE